MDINYKPFLDWLNSLSLAIIFVMLYISFFILAICWLNFDSQKFINIEQKEALYERLNKIESFQKENVSKRDIVEVYNRISEVHNRISIVGDRFVDAFIKVDYEITDLENLIMPSCFKGQKTH